MNYLITGGAGFIGSHLADMLVERGDRVTALDDLSTGSADNLERAVASGQGELVEGSTLDGELLRRLVETADVVVHLAATVGVELVVADPLQALRNNIDGTEVVLEACARTRTRVLLASTSEIYGKNRSDRLGEDTDRVMGSPKKTRWAYATSKVVDEILAYEFWRQRGTPTTVVRLFNCSGPRQTGSYGMVIPRFVRQALRGEALTVFGDGAQTRCFCHVWDANQAIIALLENERSVGEVFNVGADEEISIDALAERVIRLAGSTSAIRHVPYEEAYEPGFEDMQRRVPDLTRIRDLTGWEPKYSLDEIIRDVIDFERRVGQTRLA